MFATHYVDVNSPGPVQDGASWNTAFVDLQLALAAATAGDEIRVADGVYKPTSGTDRTISFALKMGVTINGGYAGFGVVNPDARDKGLYPSVLSGDIGIASNNSDNSYHVLIGTGTNNTAVLDGFTITAGNANGAGNDERGGGLGGLNTPTGGGPKIVNCRFIGNSAVRGGAGYISGSGTEIVNCEIESNAATLGGGIYVTNGGIILADSTFTSNVASDLGGGMYLTGSLTTNRCTFVRNSAVSGGAIYTSAIGPTWNFCQFLGNTATESGGGVYVASTQSANTTRLTNCILVGNTARRGGAIFDLVAGQLRLTNVNVVANEASFAGGGVYWNVEGLIAPPANSLFFYSSILWKNVGLQISQPWGGSVTYSNIQGYEGSGSGMMNEDPRFNREPNRGVDEIWGTPDDDYGDLRISAASPMVDRGVDTFETIQLGMDLSGMSRFQDVLTAPNIAGLSSYPDIGAYEAVPALAAHSGAPTSVVEGQNVRLSGRAAGTTTGPFSFDWEWSGDGAFDEASGPNPTLSTLGLSAGSAVTVSLRVTDAAFNSVTHETTIHIFPATVYVDQNAIGANDGTSWANAYSDLSRALRNGIQGQTIWVADGIYKPSTTGDRGSSFNLSTGLRVVGGFAGNGALDTDARDIRAFRTILSGDIGTESESSDNSYSVVTATDILSAASLDGFYILGGNANAGSSANKRGAGLLVFNSTFDAINCTFINNVAEWGGVIYGESSNRVRALGCVFLGNSNLGGSSGVGYVNCVLWGNEGVSPTNLTNSIWFNNSQQMASNAVVNFSCVEGGAAGVGNIDADPLFVRNPASGPDAVWGTSDDDHGDLRLQAGSPCIDAGRTTDVPDPFITDLGGLPRIGDTPGVRDPGFIVDIGAHEASPGLFGIVSATYRLDLPVPAIKIRFSNSLLNASLAQSDLTLSSAIPGDSTNYAMLATFTYDPSTWSGIWSFPNTLLQGNYIGFIPANSVEDAEGNPLPANMTFNMFVLPGDVNSDRQVDLKDLMILAANWQGSGKTFSQGDFNSDGVVDAADLGILAQRWQTRLDPAPPPQPAPPIPTSAVRRAPIRTPTRVSDRILR